MYITGPGTENVSVNAIHLLETAVQQLMHADPKDCYTMNHTPAVLPYLDSIRPVLQQPEQLMEQGGVQVKICQALGRGNIVRHGQLRPIRL